MSNISIFFDIKLGAIESFLIKISRDLGRYWMFKKEIKNFKRL